MMRFARAVVMTLAFACAAPAMAGTPLKVMSFNTMCDLCDLKGLKHKNGPFRERIRDIADTIMRHDPDLASLQEIRTKRQIKRIARMLDRKYHLVFANGFPLSWADPVLFISKDRFRIVRTGGGWLGPNYPGFSFGWAFKIPRRFQWARIQDLKTGDEFIFAGSHFDNSFKNKNRSAAFANNFFQKQNVPVLFAGDSNLKPAHSGYQALVGTNMRDTFDETANIEFFSNSDAPVNQDDGCNVSKGTSFPECRIDHVLLSQDAPWQVVSWGADLFRYYQDREFASDHRAVIVELDRP